MRGLRILNMIKNKLDYEYKKYLFNKNTNKIQTYHNKFLGKRCFIIGNGPSLRVEDLEKLTREICFGTHRIYEIFSQTKWRPYFYCAQDNKLIKESVNEINKIRVKNKIIAYPYSFEDRIQIKGAVYTKINITDKYPNPPDFSQDITEQIFEGFTVTYMCLQLAAYMGFSEIYLLGMDHKYSKMVNTDGIIELCPNVNDHFSIKDKITNIPQLHKSTLAYETAKKYLEKQSIKVYNVSRGGCLNVFERKNFEELKL